MKVLKVLSAGGGPDLAFRAYLLTAVRRLHVDRIRRVSKVTTTDELDSFDPGVPFADPAVQEFENVAASKAFASLPERWQLVLWHIEVEGQKPAEVAPLLGMTANSVSALAYRAREGLRQAYLQMHMADTAAEECRWVTERLGARVRNGLSRRETVKVDEHLDECARCSAVYLELSEINSNLAGILAPILLGAAASAYLASAGSGSLAAAPWLLRATHFVKGHGILAAGSTAASAVAVTVAIATITSGASPGDTAAEPSVNDHIVSSSTGPSTTSPSRTGPSAVITTRDGRGDQKPSAKTSTAPGAVLVDPSTSAAEPTLTGPTQPAQQPTSDPTTGHPTTTSPPPTTTTTTPPPPSGWDLQLSMTTTKQRGSRFRSTITVGAPAQADNITVTVSVNKAISLVFSGAGWTCTPPFDRTITTYTCTTSDSSPSALVAAVKFHPRQKGGALDATVSSPGNDDPNAGNNTASFAL
jgi:anti-sigma factor RsiW